VILPEIKEVKPMNSARTPNRLAHETSPYLLQHQYNPVDWYPWGEAAFAKAREENKPILLSVGYSACHWCHVMERESFENDVIAEMMNADFVCVKVDREERPDVDAIYMGAVQLLTGQGGWPMTVFLIPEGKPFYGGTYFPPEDRYGRAGFPRILAAVAEAWRNRRLDVIKQGGDIADALDEDLARSLRDTVLTPAILDNAFTALSQNFDPHYGGFGTAPKFPQPVNLDFLLRYHARSKRQEPLQMVEKTLQKMALGGMYDQLGGGFHRYSTDREWLAPHFEKMLYDNAQLAQTYAHAFQLTGKVFYRGIAEETLEYILREMTDPQGGFYSAQDADSEGEEGKFFVWTPAEVAEVLGERDAAIFGAFYDVSAYGNWEGVSILRVVADAPQVAAQFNMSIDAVAQILDSARGKLLEARERRIKPGLDDKCLTAWNGLMLAAFAECGAIFGRDDFVQAAERNAEFLLQTMTTGANGERLLRTWRRGSPAKLNAYLEDYAFLADGLLHLYAATGEERWLRQSRKFADAMIAQFWDDAHGGFFATSSDHETLIQRPKDWDDNAVPSGNTVACEVLLKLATYTGIGEYGEMVTRVLRRIGSVLDKHAGGFARMLSVLDFQLEGATEISLVGERTDPALQQLREVAFTPFLPNKVIGYGAGQEKETNVVAFLAERPLHQGAPTAYVCRNSTCQLPVNTPDALLAQLRS
jgi:uncharacterized protein